MQSEFLVFQSTLDRLWNYMMQHRDPATPVTLAEPPDDLRSQVDLSLQDRGLSLEELLPYIDAYLHHSTATLKREEQSRLFQNCKSVSFLFPKTSLLNNYDTPLL